MRSFELSFYRRYRQTSRFGICKFNFWINWINFGKVRDPSSNLHEKIMLIIGLMLC